MKPFTDNRPFKDQQHKEVAVCKNNGQKCKQRNYQLKIEFKHPDKRNPETLITL